MKILALTDIHGSFDSLQSIIASNPDVDALVLGGDLTTFGSAEQIKEAVRLAKHPGKPVVAVCGNMDPAELETTLSSLGVSINGKGVIVKSVGFFGVSASPFSPLCTPNEVSEEEIMRRAEAGWKDVAPARWKVFVPHTPPVNTKLDRIVLGRHVGSISVRTFIEKHQPHVTICGHIHEARGMDTIGQTKIVNCGSAAQGRYALVEIEQEVVIHTSP